MDTALTRALEVREFDNSKRIFSGQSARGDDRTAQAIAFSRNAAGRVPARLE